MKKILVVWFLVVGAVFTAGGVEYTLFDLYYQDLLTDLQVCIEVADNTMFFPENPDAVPDPNSYDLSFNSDSYTLKVTKDEGAWDLFQFRVCINVYVWIDNVQTLIHTSELVGNNSDTQNRTLRNVNSPRSLITIEVYERYLLSPWHSIDYGECRIFTDRLPPDLIDDISYSFIPGTEGMEDLPEFSLPDDGGPEIRALQLSWNKQDYDFPAEGGCGVAGYDLVWKNNDDNENLYENYPIKLMIDESTAGEVSPAGIDDPLEYVTVTAATGEVNAEIDLSQFTRGGTYTFGIRTFDKFENRYNSASGDSDSYFRTKSIVIPPEPPGIDAVAYGTPRFNEMLNKPEYPVSIALDKTPAELVEYASPLFPMSTTFYFASIIIYYQEAGESEYHRLETYSIGDLNLDPEEDNRLVRLNATLTGEQHAHRVYDYYAAVVHKKGGGLELGTGITGVDRVPNLVPDYRIKIEIPGTDWGPAVVDRYGYEPGTTNAADLGIGEQIETPLVFSLEQTYDPQPADHWLDPEADQLAIELRTINNYLITGDTGGDPGGHSLGYLSDIKETVHCYVAVTEKYPGIEESNETYTTHPPGTREEGFYLQFNAPTRYGIVHVHRPEDELRQQIIPSWGGEAVTVDLGGEIPGEISGDYPCRSSEVRLIQDEEFDFGENGTVEVCNIHPGYFPHPEELSSADIKAIMAGPETDADTGACIRGPVTADPYTWNAPWTLPAGAAGDLRIIGLRLTDGGGNISCRRKVLRWDATPPAAPAQVPDPVYDNGRINLAWEGVEEAVCYVVIYRAGEAGPVVAVVDLAEPAYAIALSGIRNQQVLVDIYAVDGAGNFSPPASLELHTPATLGAVPGPVQGLEERGDGDFSHYVMWQPDGAVLACARAGYRIHNSGEAYSYTDYQTDMPLRVDDLTAYTEYDFILEAYNSSDLLSESLEIPGICIEGYPPTRPQLTAPGPWTGLPAGFAWDLVYEPENEELEWELVIERDDSLGLGVVPDADSLAARFLSLPAADTDPDFFAHGRSYTCQMKVTDIPANGTQGTTVISDENSFTVDDGDIVISFTDFPQGSEFTGQQELHVEVEPSASGLAELYYSFGNGEFPLWFSGSGPLVTAAIPLAEDPGGYTVTVRAVNHAGTGQSLESDTIKVDFGPPAVTWAGAGTGEAEDFYYTGNSGIPCRLVLEDTGSGVAQLSWGLSPGNGVPPLDLQSAGTGLLPGPTQPFEWLQVVDFAGRDGEVTWVAFTATDFAGQQGDWVYIPKPVMLDSLPPRGTVELSGPAYYGGQYFINNIEDITAVTAVYEDEHSGNGTCYYGLAEKDSPVTAWYETWEAVKADQPRLLPGGCYQVTARVLDRAGNEAELKSSAFGYDPTAPQDVTVSGLSGDVYAEGAVVRLNVSCLEEESPVAAYRIAVGTAAEPALVSAQLNNNSGGWLVQGRGDFAFTVPGGLNGTFRVTAQAVNAAGATGSSGSAVYPLVTAAKDNQVIVWDCGPYRAGAGSLRAFWRYAGDQPHDGYQYRVTGPGYADSPWILTEDTGAEPELPGLVNGATYRFEVQAVYAGAAVTPVAVSHGVTIDTSAPVFAAGNGLGVPAACTTDNLQISWDVLEEESGVRKVEVLLESPDQDNILQVVGDGWIALAPAAAGSQVLAADAAGAPLAFRDGQRVHVTMRVTNNAGLSAMQAALPVIIDNSPPLVPLVLDQGDYIKPAQAAAMQADWLWAGDDPQSGTKEFMWTLVKDAPELPETVTWYAGPADRTVNLADDGPPGLELKNGETWYFAVKAVNGAGLASTGFSNGITIDDTKPFIAEVKLLQGTGFIDPDTEQEVRYVRNNADLHVYVAGYDPESGVSAYNVRYGIAAGGDTYDWQPEVYASLAPAPGELPDPVVPLLYPAGAGTENPPRLPENVLSLFKAEVWNNINLNEHGYSGGVKLDSSVPAVDYVNGSCTGGVMHFNWETSGSVSPVERYRLQLWRSGDGSTSPVLETADWSGTAAGLSLDAGAEGLADGRYVLRVEARNAAGSWSGVTRSNEVVLDREQPRCSVEILPLYAGNYYVREKIHFRIDARDDLSGVAAFGYALGDDVNDEGFTCGMITVPATAGTLDLNLSLEDLAVNDGTVLFVKAKVWDHAGQESAAVVSVPVIVDRTPPGTPLVDLESAFCSRPDRVTGINFSAADLQSGVVRLEATVAADTDPATLADNTLPWTVLAYNTPVQEVWETGFQAGGLEHAHGDTGYVVVRALNAVGLYSAAGYSGQLTFDLLPPRLSFTGHNGKEKNGEIIYNYEDTFTINYMVEDDLSETVGVTMTLSGPDGRLDTLDREQAPFNEVWRDRTEQEFIFNCDNTRYGLYHLYAQLEDAAGNLVEETDSLLLRINSPPRVSYGDVFTANPNRPIELYAGIEDTEDTDDEEVIESSARLFTYHWRITDYDRTNLVSHESTDARFLLQLLHRDDYDQESEYRLELTVTDSDGRSTGPVPGRVTVVNTPAGELWWDEYWSGQHEIRGDITIPPGRSLQVAPGTEVRVHADFLNNTEFGIAVYGSLTAGSGSTFRMMNDHPLYWKGITVYGTADLRGTTIRDAIRGSTISRDSDAVIDGCTYTSNLTGLHLFRNGQVINNCLFSGNSEYGIKEEPGSDPVVSGCWFSSNTIDYYDCEDTRLSIEELNEKPGNSDNNRAGG